MNILKFISKSSILSTVKSKLFTVSNINYLLEEFRLAEKSFTIKTRHIFMEFYCRLFLRIHSEPMRLSSLGKTDIFKKKYFGSYFYPALYNALRMHERLTSKDLSRHFEDV